MLGFRKEVVLGCCLASSICLGQQPNPFVGRDKQYRHGRIEYRLVVGDGAANWVETHTLVFASDGRFVATKTSTTQPGTSVKGSSDVSGDGWHYTEFNSGPERTEIAFRSGSIRISQASPLFRIINKPCFPLGLGLGQLDFQERAVQADGEIQYRFTSSPASGVGSVRVVCSAQNPLEPSILERGKASNVWRYSDYRAVGAGLRIPFRSRQDVPAIGPNEFLEYEIISADLSREPSEAELNPKWLRKDVEIWDDRAAPPVYWRYDDLVKAAGGRTDFSPKELLALSRQRAQNDREMNRKLAEKLARLKAEKQGQMTGFWAIFASVFAVGLVIIAVKTFVLRR